MGERLRDFFASVFLPAAQSFQRPLWRPLADVGRCGNGYLVKLDLAGVRPQDLQIRVGGSSLTIEGVRHDSLSRESPNYVSLEIAYSRFERTIELPCCLDHAQIASEYHDGMLVLRIQPEETA